MELKAQNWLGKDNTLGYDIWNGKYRYNNESFDEWLDRVSAGDKNIKRLISEKKFLFAGRTLANRGVPDSGSFSNCYSKGYVPDSLDGIMDVAKDLAMTYKAQGGQGVSLSKIRPKGCDIHGRFKSDGIIPFMNIFNSITENVSQGGARKGALMMSLDIEHKEAEKFITIKNDKTKINKANLSLEISDEFMGFVCNNLYNEDAYYEEERTYGEEVITYKVYAVKLFNLLCLNAWKSAEPGVLFTGALRDYNMMQYCEDYNIITTNPCGEQPLPEDSACNLSSVNVSEYVINPYTKDSYFNYEMFTSDMKYIVRAMDDVLEENIERHALEKQSEMAKKYRNLGIGIMGLSDTFVMLGMKYGSEESIDFAQDLMEHMQNHCIYSSQKLAKERGAFPMYNDIMYESDILRYKQLIEKPLRNCSLISIAPTGSIGTMLDVSTGIEPFFALKYMRKTESLNGGEDKFYEVNISAVDDYFKVNPTESELPDYFNTAYDVNPIDRVTLQAEMQKYVDTAISSTINLPKTATVEDIKDIYIEAWGQGLKGVTVYRDGSREGVLNIDAPKKRDTWIKRPKVLEADYYQAFSKGVSYIIVVGLYEDKPYEIFAYKNVNDLKLPEHKGTITKVAKGIYKFDSDHVTIENLISENENDLEKACTLYTSHLLRSEMDIPFIIKTTEKINMNISSFTSVIKRTLYNYCTIEGICPDCGSKIINDGACNKCPSCGYSKCG